jgi:hypothetical protein
MITLIHPSVIIMKKRKCMYFVSFCPKLLVKNNCRKIENIQNLFHYQHFNSKKEILFVN